MVFYHGNWSTQVDHTCSMSHSLCGTPADQVAHTHKSDMLTGAKYGILRGCRPRPWWFKQLPTPAVLRRYRTDLKVPYILKGLLPI